MTPSSARHYSPTACARVLVLAFIGIVVLGGSAAGHRTNVFAYRDGDSVVVEGYFGGKAKASYCLVEIFDADRRKLGEGKTDAQGLYRFPVSKLVGPTGDLTIILHAGAGHRAEYVLRSAEFRPVTPATKDVPGPVALKQSEIDDRNQMKWTAPTSPGGPASSDTAIETSLLVKTMEEAIDRKLGPVVHMLSQQQKIIMEQNNRGPALAEIIGGIGWIVGIVGIVAYLAARKRMKS